MVKQSGGDYGELGLLNLNLSLGLLFYLLTADCCP